MDASQITPALIADTLNEADGIETNVARGYHAIEFLLWGAGPERHRPGAGTALHRLCAGEGCTGGNCDRRAAYLAAASALLVSDLDFMVAQWSRPGPRVRPCWPMTARPGPMLTGMGSLSYGEQAGERMRLGLMQ